MKVLMTAILLAVAGCAGGQPDGTFKPNENEEASTVEGGNTRDSDKGETESVGGDVSPALVLGTFENASCGQRKYNRRISFFEGGELVAVDEVAPCPADAECVWSGIIDWKGTWSLQDKIITIEISMAKNERMPETLPDSFVVLTETPLTLGEKEGTLVCPYSRVQ